eukprot:4342549-Prymnesium_polylepis.1
MAARARGVSAGPPTVRRSCAGSRRIVRCARSTLTSARRQSRKDLLPMRRSARAFGATANSDILPLNRTAVRGNREHD